MNNFQSVQAQTHILTEGMTTKTLSLPINLPKYTFALTCAVQHFM